MDEQKKVRLAAAITVNVILLIAILTVVLIFQIVTIAVKKGEYAKLVKEKEYYTQKLQESQDELDYIKDKDFLLHLAFYLGYQFPEVPNND